MKELTSVVLCVECCISDEDEARSLDAAGFALFSAEGLCAQMGYKKGEATEDDYLGIAQMMAERVAESLQWASAPMVDASVDRKGGLIKAVVNPGFIGRDAWEAFSEGFAEICALYGNEEARFAEGGELSALLDAQLEAARPKRESAEPAAKAPKM